MSENILLVVDDNEINLKLVKTILELDGYKVITALNGKETLDIIKNIVPKLILMDLQLPDMDGLTVTKKIKEIEIYKNIPIIALTALAMKGAEEKAIDYGIDAYITKPFEPDELSKIVKEYFK